MSATPTDDALYGSDKAPEKSFLDDILSFIDSSPSTELADSASGVGSPLDESPEEREGRLAALKEELEKVESEINMLRGVLGSKIRHATELKRQLGITPFQEFKQDLQLGIQQIKSSDSYQKTSAVVKTASEKTTSAINSMGQAVARKLSNVKNSQTFKSFDEKVHTTYATVKSSRSIEGLRERLAKVTGSRSSSEIDEAFRDAHSNDDDLLSTPESAEDASNIKLPEEKVPL
ncbi:tumor protein D52-like isoform X4 [Biomphalaria glabrata]|uniref:Tumor protein D52-like isoform X4 n=1 Tax=Biomphalaria glabrata TaxID=6526 RepID=A0A9W2Z7Z1_BIOGL|nr:tumor protein D52-like isoform X4 [Biomphalaria glabrata]